MIYNISIEKCEIGWLIKMRKYTLLGTELPLKKHDIRSWSLQAKSALEALSIAANFACNDEMSQSDRDTSSRTYHFTLMSDTPKGTKTILTVQAQGKGLADAMQNAYRKVCAWQGREPVFDRPATVKRKERQ